MLNNNLLRYNDNLLINKNRVDIEIDTNSYECSPRDNVDRKNGQSLKELLNIDSVPNQKNKSPLFKKKINSNINRLRINKLGRNKNNN